jgi:hypothetical protein
MLQYRHSNTRVLILFRLTFTVFLASFIVTGTGISYVDSRDDEDPVQPMSLWHGCTDLIIAIFVAVPCHKLVRVVSYPVVPDENVSCVRWSQLLVAIFCLIVCGRAIYNICHYFHANILERWMSNQLRTPGKPGWRARLVTAGLIVVFDFVTSLCAIAGVRLIRTKRLLFADKKYYENVASSRRDPL